MSKLLVLISCAIFVAIVQSNQLGGDEHNIKKLPKVEEYVRNVRQADDPPDDEKFKPYNCCKVKVTQEQQDKMREVRKLHKQCSDELGYGEKPNHKKGAWACISECVGQKLNYIDADKKLSEDAFKEFVKTKMAVLDHQKPLADEITDKCLEKAKKVGGSSEESNESNGKKCSKVAVKLGMCVWRKLAKSCPKDLQEQSEDCDRFRKGLERDFKHKEPQPE